MSSHLQSSLLGTRLTGRVSKWMGQYGFIKADGYEDTVFLTANQFKDQVEVMLMPTVGMEVVFELGRNDKGWRAVDCRRRPGTRPTTFFQQAATSSPISAVKYPVQYDAARVSKDQLEVFEQSMRFHRLYKQCGESFFLLATKTIAATYEKVMEKFVEGNEEGVLSNYRGIKVDEDWDRVKELQKNKAGRRDAHSISVEELRCLHTFKRFLRCPKFTEAIKELLSEYTAKLSTNSVLPAFAKGAWMLVHFSSTVEHFDIPDEEENAELLLTNWALLQHDVPFLATTYLPDELLGRRGKRSFHHLVNDLLLARLTDEFSEFDEHFNNALTPPVPEPVDPDKIVTAHRKKLHESEVCFICFDDSVKCTVSLLCCGQASHSRCLQQWHDSRCGDNGGNAVGGAGSCPGCRQRCVEPVIAGGRNARAPHSDSEDEEEEYQEEEMCAHCGRQRAARDCRNNCCGRCCGASVLQRYCERHGNVMDRNLDYWSAENNGDDHHNDDDSYYEEDSYEDEQSNYGQRPVDWCQDCGRRARAQDCTNGCCGVCCRNGLEYCSRHGG